MKQDDPQPLVPVTDEVMEARIVAWVLGEASAFEIAELERLCAEQPELDLFRRRMLAVQGLLEEAVVPDGDAADWKLPAAKRGVLDEAFGTEEPHAPAGVSSTRTGRGRPGWQWFGAGAGIAASVTVAWTAWQFHETGRLDLFSRHGSATAAGERVPSEAERRALAHMIREQEDKVEERRKALSNIVREKEIVYRGGGAIYGDEAENAHARLEQGKVVLDSQIKALAKYDGDQLMNYASGLDLPENTVMTLYPRFLETQRELDAARSENLAESDPKLKELQARADAMKKDLDSGVVNLRDVLRAKLEITTEQLDQIASQKGSKGGELVRRSIDTQDYANAKLEFEQELEQLQKLKSRYQEYDLLARAAKDTGGKVPSSPRARTTSGSSLAENVKPAGYESEGLIVQRETKLMEGGLRAGNQEILKDNIDEILNGPTSRFTPVQAPGAGSLSEGRQAYARGDYQKALDHYKKAMEQLPDTPALKQEREEYAAHVAHAGLALAQEKRRVGRYDEARELLGGVLSPGIDPDNVAAKRELGYLDDPVRTNPLLPPLGGEPVDDVRRSLYLAEGNYNLGKYEDAKREYESVLRKDPSNKGARIGLERIASAKSDYYRAAYDHTSAELLAQVDQAWEVTPPSPAPAAAPAAPAEMAPVDAFAATADSPKPTENEGQGIGFGTGMAEGQAKLQKAEKAVPPAEIDFEEIAAAEEAFSTFSLSVGDVSFQLAKAALERGETPAPDSIKVEQFYNAVDYRDPAPENGEPVAGVVEQSAHPVIPGRNLVRMGIRTAAAGRAQSQPLRLTLLIDQSGSMAREDRKEAMTKAIAGLSKLLTPADQVTVIGFSRTPRILVESLGGDRVGDILALVNPEAGEGGTNLEEAMKLSHDLAVRHRMAGAQNRIVLFTDGAANLGDADPARLSALVTAMRNGGLAFDVAGVGTEDLNDRLLADLARNGNGRYYLAAENLAAQLAGAFRPAAEDVKVQVKFNPDRVSRYKLVGFEESRLKTEDFRNDAVDAAELSAEEAAVALYQVELVPGGRGDIGDMSVRFRDAATGSTVERSWSIPFDEAAPAFDRAPPSVQLAGLSMLAAEKLKGGPLGQAIDFRRLSPSVLRVKNYYAGSGSVSDMLQVIGTLSR